MDRQYCPGGISVAKLKEIIASWPDTGEVWIGTIDGLCVPATKVIPIGDKTNFDMLIE